MSCWGVWLFCSGLGVVYWSVSVLEGVVFEDEVFLSSFDVVAAEF